MEIKNVVGYSGSLGEVPVLLGVGFDTNAGGKVRRELITVRDIIKSEFVYDVISSFFHLQVTGVDDDGVCLFALKFEPTPDAVVVKLPGIAIGAGPLNLPLQEGPVKFSYNLYKSKCGGSEMALEAYISEINAIANSLPDALKALREDAERLELFRVYGGHQIEIGENPDVDKYLDAIEQHVNLLTNYTTMLAEKKPIWEHELILPYNAMFLKRVQNGKVIGWSTGEPGVIGEIGQNIPLPVPDYKELFAYYYKASNVEDDTEVDGDTEVEDEGDTGVTQEFRDTASVSGRSKEINFIDTSTDNIEAALASYGFTVANVPDSIAHESCRGRLKEIRPNVPDIYKVHTQVPGYDSFYYNDILSDPEWNTLKYPLSYVCGSQEADLAELYPRELAWMEGIKSLVLASKMFEDSIFTVTEAEAKLASGSRPRYVNMFFKELLESVLPVTRQYTGRVTFDMNDYETSSSEESEESLYVAARTCFYTPQARKKFMVSEPEGYNIKFGGGYRPLKQGIASFVDTYVKSPVAWPEVFIKLMRGGEYKITTLSLTGAAKENKQGETAVYFDLNESRVTDIIGGEGNLIQTEGQEIAFCIRLTNKAMETQWSAIEPKIRSVCPGPGKFVSGFPVAFGLWNDLSAENKSRMYILDVFTFTDYVKTKRKLGSVETDIPGLKYSDADDLFYMDSVEEEGEIDKILNTPTTSSMVSGSIGLNEFMNLGAYNTQIVSEMGRTITEYREVVESLEYLQLKSELMSKLDAKKLNTAEYGILQELRNLCNSNMEQIDRDIVKASNFHAVERITASTSITSVAHATLKADYCLKFIRLIKYCDSIGMGAYPKLTEYLNAVNKFMAQDKSGAPSAIAKYESTLKLIDTWCAAIGQTANMQTPAVLYYIGCQTANGVISRILLVEVSEENKELLSHIHGILKDNPGQKKQVPAKMAYTKILTPVFKANPTCVIQANPMTLKYVNSITSMVV